MPRRVFAPLICLCVVASLAFGQQANSLSELSLEQNKLSAKLSYTPGPVDNPLKGLVPYQADVRKYFPHSMEFNYLAFADLVKDYDTYDFSKLETLLNDVASRGHQTVFRVYLEYPKKTGVIPKFLVNDGLKVHRYLNTNTAPLPPAEVETPDYQNPKLRKVLTDFIAELGKRYDGDPRIAFITAGLLGTWGEWHTYPKSELFAKKDVQNEVLDAYESAFKVTPILLRYPAGNDDDEYASTTQRKMGYHDDSFCWATLDTGKKNDDWYFVPRLKQAGVTDRWKTHPIGGEIRPEAWRKVFDDGVKSSKIQDFVTCVQHTNASWLMDSGMFERRPTADLVERAKEKVQTLGYDYHVAEVSVERINEGLAVSATVVNKGVAPFYYDWPIEFAILAKSGMVAISGKSASSPKGLLPGEQTTWQATIPIGQASRLDDGAVLALRVVHPLRNGNHFRFANLSQDQHRPGWLTLLPAR